MAYDKYATGDTPALIVYLIDISASMNQPLEGRSKIDWVNEAIERILITMVKRSTKGAIISPRYRVAMAAYSEEVYDILGGILPINEVVKLGHPTLSTDSATDTKLAFEWARDLLEAELPKLDDCPAPMVCHLTDGAYTHGDPAPIAHQIMQMENPDGNVLVENIYVGADLTYSPINDVEEWTGILEANELKNPHAQNLFRLSSNLPNGYANVLAEEGYSLSAGSRMIIPGSNSDLIELAFAMSQATPTRQFLLNGG